jgi:hypothetical protein
MNTRSRISRLEQALKAHTVGLTGRDGRRLPVTTDNVLDCLLAAMLGEDHSLMEIVRGARHGDDDGKILRLIRVYGTPGHREFMESFRGGELHALHGPN